MKKLFVTVALLICTTSIVAQTTTQRKKLAEERDFTVYQTIVGEDTSVYYYFSFQNAKYQHITDLGSILLSSKKDILELSSKLKEYTETKERVSLVFATNDYSVSLYDFSNNIYLVDKKGKYTIFTKKQALKLSEALLTYVELLKI